MTGHAFFYLGLSLMRIHEMDVVRCKEWRIFPGLSQLNDKVGLTVFTFAHVPLFFVLFYLLTKQGSESLIIGLNYFFINKVAVW